MRRATRSLALVLVMAAALLTPAGGTAAPTGATISGVVRGGSSLATPATVVRAHPVGVQTGEQRVRESSLGQGERWRIENLAPGRYRILVTHDFVDSDSTLGAWTHEWYGGGASEVDATVVTVRPGQVVDSIDFTRSPGASISGTVKTPEEQEGSLGRIAADVETAPGRWERVPHGGVSVPENGVFRYGGLPAGRVRLHFAGAGDVASGWVGGGDEPSSARVFHLSGGEHMNMGEYRARRGAHIAGQVQDSAGLPVSGMRVAASQVTADDVRHVAFAETDASGHYRLTGLDSGEHVLHFVASTPYVDSYSGPMYPPFADDPERDAGRVPTRAGTTTQLDHVVRRMTTIHVRVSDENGPMDRFSVEVLDLSGRPVPAGGQVVGDAYEVGLADARPVILRFGGLVGVHVPEYHRDAPTAAAAEPVRLVPEGDVVVEATLRTSVPVIDVTRPTYGQTVTADLPGIDEKSEGMGSFRWYRDDERITDAWGPSYSVTSADVGHRLSVAHSVDGRHVRRSAPTAVVTPSETDVRVTAKAKGSRKVALTVRAVGRSAEPGMLDGAVVVHRSRKGSDRIRTITMRDGRATVTLTRQPKGRRSYYVDLAGTAGLLEPDRSPKTTVKVR